MASSNSKLHFVVFMIIVSVLLANKIQSTRVMDDQFPECEFKGPCQIPDDCIATCGGKPSHCIPNPSVDILQCCCLSS
ncbi:putative defensin-like protein [Cardamine amara subsp. amara]|uniref:Defensin-like protein n=1 Tax=Cardamine amara subsp. amara TaxID=228776 RepID=A0ABD1BI14_CARAN